MSICAWANIAASAVGVAMGWFLVDKVEPWLADAIRYRSEAETGTRQRSNPGRIEGAKS